MPRRPTIRAFILAALLSGVSFASATAGETSSPCVPMPVVHRAVPPIDPQLPRDAIAVASLNMAARPEITDTLAAWTQRRSIDVLLLQEVGGPSVDGGAFVAALSERLGFHFAYAPANQFGDARTQGLAIVSRDPIADVQVDALKHHRLRFRSRCRVALTATVITADGPVRIINVHLDTRINSKDRLAQLSPVLEGLQGDDIPQIIGGDFNTMNIGWYNSMWPFPYVQRQASAVRELLAGDGFHTPFESTRATFNRFDFLEFFGFPLKLDWLYLKALEAIDWSVDEVRYSDHRGIWARVKSIKGSRLPAPPHGARYESAPAEQKWPLM